MNKLFAKIGVVVAGFALAIGTGIGAINGTKDLRQAKAAEQTVSWTATAANNLGSTIASVNGTDSGTVSTGTFSWDYTRTLVALTDKKTDYMSYVGATSNKYIQLGSGNSCETLSFTTSAFQGKIIKSISVICLKGASGGHKLSISIGGNTYNGCSNVALTQATIQNNNLTSTHADGTKTYSADVTDSTGNITITLGGTTTKKALYIAGISVTYTNSSGPTKGTLAITPVDGNALSVGQTGTFGHTITSGSQVSLSTQSWRSSDSDKLEFTNAATGAFRAKAAGSVTVYVSGTDADSFEYDEVSYALTINEPTPGSRYLPYSVAQASSIISGLADNGETDFVYTTGIISSIDSVELTQYFNATYYISDDGTETGQLQVFRGKFLDNTDFSSEDQIQTGDTVIVYGKLIKYVKNETTTPEIGTGNYLVSLKSSPRLTLSQTSITVTNGTNTSTVTATPTSFDEGEITYEFDTNACASLSHVGNTITITGLAVGSYTFTITGKVGGVTQASATLTVTVVAPYPTAISRTQYASFTDTQRFVDGTGSVTITYSDASNETKHLGDTGVKLYISDVEIDVNSSVAPYLGANSAKITYTENDVTVSTSTYTLNVNPELVVTSFANIPEYLIVDSESPNHSAEITVNYKSLNGEPELAIASSNPEKLIVTYDSANNNYDSGSKTGAATFTITAGAIAGQYSAVASITYGTRTESKSFSINVRNSAPTPVESAYEKVESLADLTTGDYVIAVDSGSVYGMTRTISSGKYAFSDALTVTNDKIASTAGDGMKFHLSVSGSGDANRTVTVYNPNTEKYVKYGSSANLAEQDATYNWTVTKPNSNGTFAFASQTDNRGLVARTSTYNVFGGYQNSAVNGTEYFNIELFKKVESQADPFELVNTFVANYMHMSDVSLGNIADTGACKGESGYYLTAKRGWNTMVTSSSVSNDTLQETFRTSFADAYDRYMAWADACGDTQPFVGTTIASSQITFFDSRKNNNTLLIIVIVSAVTGASLVGLYFLLRRRKHQ